MDIVTYTGRVIDPLRPDPDQIVIEDIAHALSNMARFTGHTRVFYSVADHSIRCTAIVSQENSLTALMHDASEAYLTDIASPVKRDPDFGPFYRSAEARLERVIAARFGLKYPYPKEVHDADDILFRTEQRDLMPDALRGQGRMLPAEIIPLTPKQAKRAFLRTFELCQETAA
jgi:hypothetical protein